MDQLCLRDCPICGDASFDLVYKVPAKDFHGKLYGVSYASIVRCRMCGFVHTNPILNSRLDEDQYRNPAIGYHTKDAKSPQELCSTDHFLCLEEIRRHIGSPHDTLLDFGCGCGGFVFLCQAEGLRAKGIDLDTAGIAVGSRLGIQNLHCSDIAGEPDNYYDCVVCVHVLEHCRDIRKTANQFLRVLKPGGICVISVPNYRSWRLVAHPIKYWSEAYMHINGLTNRYLDRVFKDSFFDRVRMRAAVPGRDRLGFSTKTWVSLFLTKWLGNWLRLFPTKLVCVYRKRGHGNSGPVG